jgi:hypothetical protein
LTSSFNNSWPFLSASTASCDMLPVCFEAQYSFVLLLPFSFLVLHEYYICELALDKLVGPLLDDTTLTPYLKEQSVRLKLSRPWMQDDAWCLMTRIYMVF